MPRGKPHYYAYHRHNSRVTKQSRAKSVLIYRRARLLRAIVGYLGRDNPNGARSFGQELRDRTKPFAQHPELGRTGRPGLPH
jgi:hypothetical protein